MVRNQTERIQGAHAGLGGDGRVEVELGPGEEVDGEGGKRCGFRRRGSIGVWAVG